MRRNKRKRRWQAKILGRRTLLQSKFFRVVEEDVVLGGKRFTYQFRPHSGVVHVVALTPQGQTILVRQYRHPVRRALLELPAGVINVRESALAAAKRELMEETGYASRRWVYLGGWYPSPASTNMKSYIFLAQGVYRVRPAAPERFEFLRVERRPFAEMVRRFGKMKDVPATFQLGLALAAHHLKEA